MIFEQKVSQNVFITILYWAEPMSDLNSFVTWFQINRRTTRALARVVSLKTKRLFYFQKTFFFFEFFVFRKEYVKEKKNYENWRSWNSTPTWAAGRSWRYFSPNFEENLFELDFFPEILTKSYLNVTFFRNFEGKLFELEFLFQKVWRNITYVYEVELFSEISLQ